MSTQVQGTPVPATNVGQALVAAAEKKASKAKPAKPAAKPQAAKPKAEQAQVQGATMTGKQFVEKHREGTIGRLTAELVVAGKMTNEEILAAIKKQHKASNTTMACIAWYRSKARKLGAIK